MGVLQARVIGEKVIRIWHQTAFYRQKKAAIVCFEGCFSAFYILIAKMKVNGTRFQHPHNA